MLEFTRLKKNLKKDFSQLRKVKVAVLADSSSQLFCQTLRGYGYEAKIDFEIYEADYDQIERQVYDFSSDLYKFIPDFIFVAYSPYKLLSKFYKIPEVEKLLYADKILEDINGLISSIQSSLTTTKIVLLNFQEIEEGIFGNFANKLKHSFLYQIRKINFHLMDRAEHIKSLFICDVQSLQNQYGVNFILNNKNYINADMIWSVDFLPVLAKNITDIIGASIGQIKKCLIIDLDNTIWGGIIGDDGIEGIQIGDLGIGKAYTEIQYWVKGLKNRGVIICVCSKNTEEIAKKPFREHPEMVLRLQDISVFIANWENKVDNIFHIQQVLNIGFDSMVFLDDSSYERGIVKKIIPELNVPNLPEDPVDYLPYLKSLNLFETASFSSEDKSRTEQYQEEAKRVVYRKIFRDENNYLQSIEMKSGISEFNRFNAPRIAQLSIRSNQFNLRTIRYSEEEINKIIESPNHYHFVFSLSDKFGDSGLIAVVILLVKGENLFIDTWLMSCRVLKRGMEQFILNTLVKCARKKGFKFLEGEYIRTAKNGIVKDLFGSLGFIEKKGFWYLNINDFKNIQTFISEL